MGKLTNRNSQLFLSDKGKMLFDKADIGEIRQEKNCGFVNKNAIMQVGKHQKMIRSLPWCFVQPRLNGCRGRFHVLSRLASQTIQPWLNDMA